MLVDTAQSNYQVDDANLISGLESKIEGIDRQIDDLSRKMKSLSARRAHFADSIAMIRDDKQLELGEIREWAQKPIGKETITDFIRGIFRSNPTRRFSAKEIVAQVRLGKQSGMLELESANLLQSAHNVLSRISGEGKELQTRGKRQKRRYKLRPLE